MISLDLLRQNPESYKQAAKNKNREVDIGRILVLDTDIKKLETQIQELRTERNKLAQLGKTDPEGSRVKGK